MIFRVNAIVIVVLLVISACATEKPAPAPQSRVIFYEPQKKVYKPPQYPATKSWRLTSAPDSVIDFVDVGMTEAQVRTALGKPDSVLPKGSSSMWVWDPSRCYKETRSGVRTIYSRYGTSCNVTFDVSGRVKAYSKGGANATSRVYR